MKRILKKSIEDGKRISFVVKGDSMSPFIKSGERVEIERAEKIRIGDILLFKRRNEFLLHRVIFVFENFFITKGDRSPFIDPPVERKNIIGKLKKKESSGMRIVRTVLSVMCIPVFLTKFVFSKI